MLCDGPNDEIIFHDGDVINIETKKFIFRTSIKFGGSLEDINDNLERDFCYLQSYKRESYIDLGDLISYVNRQKVLKPNEDRDRIYADSWRNLKDGIIVLVDGRTIKTKNVDKFHLYDGCEIPFTDKKCRAKTTKTTKTTPEATAKTTATKEAKPAAKAKAATKPKPKPKGHSNYKET